MKPSRTHKRGAVHKAGSKLIAVWLPQHLFDLLETTVERSDTDRSKFIREAIREHSKRKLCA